MNMRVLLVIGVLGWFVGGCASVTSSTSQSLHLVTVCGGERVNGADCSLTNSKGAWQVTTPGAVVVHKAYGDLTVSCQKDGFLPSEKEAYQSSANNGVAGNLLLGGLIGYAVDASNGAGFDYPQRMTVAFDPPCGEG